MKFRSLSCIVAVALVLGIFAELNMRSPLFAGAERYVFFVGNTSADCREIVTENLPVLYEMVLNDINGQAAQYGAETDVDAILDKYEATVIFTEELSDSLNLYCRANLPYAITLYGETINLHICVRQDKVLVASPILFGGY